MTFARDIRLRLAREHLDRAAGDDGDLIDPVDTFNAFAESARLLEEWTRAGRSGARPPGRLRPYRISDLSEKTKAWATPLYERMLDPDARSRSLRRNDDF